MVVPASTLFAVPGMSQISSTLEDGSRRRKRSHAQDAVETRALKSRKSPASSEAQFAEYTAVVTPAERSQRRLAGITLEKAVPEHPFPHKNVSPPSESLRPREQGDRNTNDKPSLHTQHVAAVTAILHQCMLSHDYRRAGRALGLLLRSDVGGRPIDIRSEGLWTIAAEILLRQTTRVPTTPTDGDLLVHAVSREGFERAKLYYETLIVQFPQHKAWTDATNARDFCIAVFGLWICAIQHEADQLGLRDSNDREESDDTQLSVLQVKVWELARARKIAEELVNRTRDMVLKDDLELLRLQGLVALWIADLAEDCVELEEVEKQQQLYDHDELSMEDNNVERLYLPPVRAELPPISRAQEIDEARAFAQDVMTKLARHEEQDS